MKNVLVVDDNAIVRRHLKGLLERDGCVVCEAADGEQALALLDARGFDVMFLDLAMPRLGGLGVLQALAARRKVVPTVLITSTENSAEVVAAFKLGAKEYLLKPFREPQIRRAMQQVTGLDYTTLQRTRSDLALLDGDEGLAQALKGLSVEGDALDVAESMGQVPAVLERSHQLVLIGRLGEAGTGAEAEEAEALADLASQKDPRAALVRLLPGPRTALPEVTVFHAAAARTDEAALKRVLRAVKSGGALTSGRLVRALHYDGPLELDHLYWWTLRHSVEAALVRLLVGGSRATLDLSLAPGDEDQLNALVDWAMEFAESKMMDLALVREPVSKVTAAVVRPVTGIRPALVLDPPVQAEPPRAPAPAAPAATPASATPSPGATRVQPAELAARLAASARPASLPATPAPAGPPAPSLPSPAPAAGPQRFPGFELGALLGEGGMSQVYLATQRSLRRQVCIKVMRDEVASDPSLAARFQDEGVALAALRHPNIVSVLDVGRTDDGQLYMVMEYVDGGDLREFAARYDRVPFPKAVEVVSQLLSGLGEAHGHGIIHRDLKPSNILLSTLRDQTTLVKLVDFGIAKLLEGLRGGPGHTRQGMVVGTPGYMAPEQLLGMEVGFATDLYAVGVILFELVAGQRPFVARDEFELAQLTMMRPVPHLQEVLGAAAPPGLDRLLGALLAKNPKDRPQSAAQVRAELLAIPLPAAA